VRLLALAVVGLVRTLHAMPPQATATGPGCGTTREAGSVQSTGLRRSVATRERSRCASGRRGRARTRVPSSTARNRPLSGCGGSSAWAKAYRNQPTARTCCAWRRRRLTFERVCAR
jgi:hypothetical protein